VQNIYLRCGHAEALASYSLKWIRCTSIHCKFSPNHPSNCVLPWCGRTCNQ
ncbi:hypothetical protein B0H12DRAFT_962979, partial [Mycena haematopus]